MSKNELHEVRARYDRRLTAHAGDRYSPFLPVSIHYRQERERAFVKLLGGWLAGRKLSECKIIEIGCGSGANLLQLISLGARPENLIANELLDERIASARNNLPAAVRLLAGDATTVDIADGSLDIVLQSTVLSSILDPEFRLKLATRMLQWLKPGGCVLWYDFTFDNPNNSDVVGIPMAEIKRLFPGCEITTKRVTLAPPIARRLGPLTNLLYPILNFFPFLRTHVVCVIRKS